MGLLYTARCLAIVIFAVSAIACTSGPPTAQVIPEVTVIDATGAPVAGALVVLDGTRIRAVGSRQTTDVPSGARIIHAQGKVVMPGLADMHNHLRSGLDWAHRDAVSNLRRLFRCGITLTFSPGLTKEQLSELRRAAADERAPYARFFSSGPLFRANAEPPEISPPTPQAARAAVRELVELGADAIKLVHDDFGWMSSKTAATFDREIIAAIIDEAHLQRRKVLVHAPVLALAKEALRLGADGLMHGIISDPVDDEMLSLMTKNGAVYVSTLSLFESIGDFEAWTARLAAFDEFGFVARSAYEDLRHPAVQKRIATAWDRSAGVKAQLPVLRANLQRVHDAGVRVVIGTDTGLLGVILGIASHIELLLHVEAGLSPQDTLRAATIDAARMVGREQDLGSVEAGKIADLLILDASPVDDIRNTRRIHRVIRAGRAFDPAELERSTGKVRRGT